jgi:CHAD domain-containing protein
MIEHLEMDKKIFLKKIEKITDNFSRILQEYIKNPNEANVHDIRVTIRRLETSYHILPKSVRKSEMIREHMKQIKLFFKLNTEIRDYDIICSKMESKYIDQTYYLVTILKNYRTKKLHSAIEIALKILHKSTPKIPDKMIKESKLNRRYLKVIDKIKLDIQKNTIIALGDEKKIEELHMLRKDFKKLRYSLELSSNKRKIVQILKNLKKIQDVLGDIHDNDIIIDHLRSVEQNSKYLGIIESEVVERSKKYHTFITALKNQR